MIRYSGLVEKPIQSVEEEMPDRVKVSSNWLIESVFSSIEELRASNADDISLVSSDELALLKDILSKNNSDGKMQQAS